MKRINVNEMTDGDQLRYVLSKMNMTIQEFANRARVSYISVTRFMNNEVKPESRVWFKIVDAFYDLEGVNDLLRASS